eukprot:GHVP01051936.1.p1 GENE.GHVP01051936.1~~GHVP01051936.1.p1  ORF type:complete len:167 (+),score=44.92 GHVP01051936.1:72-572(+)
MMEYRTLLRLKNYEIPDCFQEMIEMKKKKIKIRKIETSETQEKFWKSKKKMRVKSKRKCEAEVDEEAEETEAEAEAEAGDAEVNYGHLEITIPSEDLQDCLLTVSNNCKSLRILKLRGVKGSDSAEGLLQDAEANFLDNIRCQMLGLRKSELTNDGIQNTLKIEKL